MVLDEFLVKLGVISDPKDMDTFVNGLKQVTAVATAATAVVGGITTAVTSFFGKALSGLDDLNTLADDTDTNLAYIQKLGYAAELSGSSVAAANASVKGLAQTIGEAADGIGRGKQAFEAYGLSAKNADGSIKSVGDVLDDVQAKMDGMSKQQQLSMLQKLGIDQSMIGLLGSTNAEMAELFQQAEDLGLITAHGADAAGEFNDALSQMDMVMSAIRTNIAVGLAPQLTQVVGRTRDWLIRNKELIREGIDRAVTVILSLWRAIMRTIHVVDQIIERTIGWKAALIILGGTFAWLNRAMLLAFATNPVTLIAAAITSLILFVDDLITFMEGGESMFDWSWAIPIIEELGVVIDQVGQGLREFWDNHGQHVMDGFAGLWNFIAGFFTWISNSFNAVIRLLMGDWDGFLAHGNAAMEGLERMFLGMVEVIKNQFLILVGLLGVDIDALTGKFTGAWDTVKNSFSEAMGVISSLWDKVSGSITKGLDAIGGAIGWVADKLGLSSDAATDAVNSVNEAAATSPGVSAQIPNEFAGVTPTGGGSNSTVSQINDIKVTQHIVTNDSSAAAKQAEKGFERVLQQTTANAQGAYGL